MMKYIYAAARRHPFRSLMLYLVSYMGLFFLLEQHVQARYIIHCRLDDIIPFCKWFIIPYVFWYFWVAGILLYFMKRDERQFWKMFSIMASGCAAALAIYGIFPNGLHLRETVVGTGIMNDLVRLLYKVDSATNVCPSLHVFQTLCVYFGIRRSETLEGKTGFHVFSLTVTLLICASTLFLRQHSVIDVLCAAALYVLLDGVSRYVNEPRRMGVMAPALRQQF